MATGSNTPPTIKCQPQDDAEGATAGVASVYSHSPLLSLAQAAAVVNMEEE